MNLLIQASRGHSVVAAEYTWPLSGNVTAQVVITGNVPTPREIDMLVQYLGLAKTALTDAPVQDDVSTTTEEPKNERHAGPIY